MRESNFFWVCKMSGIDLMRTLEKIKNTNIVRDERLQAIMSLKDFELTVIEPNLKMILLTLTELAKRVEAGNMEELEFFGVLLIQISRLLETLPKHIKKVFKVIKLIMKNFSSTLKGFGLVSLLTAFKHFFSGENELVFDEDVKAVIKKTIREGSAKIRERALETLFIALWNVPWALNEYMDIIKEIMENEGDPLYDKLFEYLSLIGKRNFYSVRPIVNALLERYPNSLDIPDGSLRFIANLVIPIRELEFLEKIRVVLEEVIIKHKNQKIRAMALVNFANNFRHPKFVEQKRRLIDIIKSLTSVEENIEIIIASLRAISICIWRNLDPPVDLIKTLISYYDRIQDDDTKIMFLDTLLLVYSNIPESAGPIIEFAAGIINVEKGNMDVLWKLQEMLSTIAISEVNVSNLQLLAKKILDLMKLPERELRVSIRVILLENIILSIAKREPRIILSLADDLIATYNQSPGVSIFDGVARIIYETLRRVADKTDATLKLLNLLLNPPEIDATYETILKYLIGLGKKYSSEIAAYIDFITDVFRTIKEAELTITDPRERYFAVDEAIKNLSRLIVMIMHNILPEDYDSFGKILAAMYATQKGEQLRDVLYAIIKSREVPELFNYVVGYLKKMTLSEIHRSLLQKVGIFKEESA